MRKTSIDTVYGIFERPTLPKRKLVAGSTANKFPVYLDDGKTIVFIKDPSQETRTKQKYEDHQNTIR